MTAPIPAHIHPKLRCYTYVSTRKFNQVLTNSVTRTVPGDIRASVDIFTTAGGVTSTGPVSVRQSMDTVVEQQYAGSIAHYYALFRNEQGDSVEFKVEGMDSMLEGSRLHLWLDKEFWLFQFDHTPEPHVIMGPPPHVGNSTSQPPISTSGLPLSSTAGQLAIRTALWSLRDYLARIGKCTPRTFLDSGRLQGVLSKASAEAAAKYNYAKWPLPKPGSEPWSTRLLWPLLRFRPAPIGTTFSPTQVVGGRLSKRWLALGVILGTVMIVFHVELLVQDVMHALHYYKPWYYTTLSGALAIWLGCICVALLALRLVMPAFVKKPFKFDEDEFFRLVNLPYHLETPLGFTLNALPLKGRQPSGKDLLSDADLESRRVWYAHDQFAFFYKSYDQLAEMLGTTKLTEQERTAALNELRSFPIPF